jgi:hypothetical protein
MRDVEELIRALEGPAPPPGAPAWPRRRPWGSGIAAALALAAAVLLTVWAWAPDDGGPSTRGIDVDGIAPVELEMRMVVERGGIAVRISPDAPLQVGERVLFRASATRTTPAALWVEGPTGRERIATLQLDPVPRDVGGPRGLVGYRFDAPGRYTFSLSADGAPCKACAATSFEVGP